MEMTIFGGSWENLHSEQVGKYNLKYSTYIDVAPSILSLSLSVYIYLDGSSWIYVIIKLSGYMSLLEFQDMCLYDIYVWF